MEKHFIPELLAPAGSLEKLKVVINYGANAVYLGGQDFSLRSAADNLTNDELIEGVAFAHDRSAKVYVVLNSFLHDKELEELPPFVTFLEEISVDAVIVSDIGVLQVVKEYSNIPIHLSTQASCINSSAGKLWKAMGVQRLILGREVSVSEAAKIKEDVGLPVEIFIHGSMCMTYSGNCVISNYTQGRDSNRGGCAHSCRFEYSLGFNEEKPLSTFFMSSKDLEGVDALTQMIEEQIDSLKIEGRMKGHLYAGTVTKVYAELLQLYKKDGAIAPAYKDRAKRDLRKVVHRDYCSGNLIGSADNSTIYDEREHDGALNEYAVAGYVMDIVEDQHILIEVRKSFNRGDSLEIVPFKGESICLVADDIKNVLGVDLTRTKPSSLVKLPYLKNVEKWNLVRIKETL